MVTAFNKFFKKYIKPSAAGSDEVSERSLQLATAALLMEMMRADAEITGDERKMVMSTIMTRFHLTEEESGGLLQFAEQKIRKATGYYEFTSLINKGFTYEQKVRVIENLWEIALTDKYLDKHEEHMVRRIADLIYVEHKDFIDGKLRIKKKLGL
jgi:uncharacterized tellurite resistance protein B-like protein